MNEPKNIYLDISNIEEGDNYQVDAYLTPDYEEEYLRRYLSINHLKNWIKKNYSNVYLDELLIFIEEL